MFPRVSLRVLAMPDLVRGVAEVDDVKLVAQRGERDRRLAELAHDLDVRPPAPIVDRVPEMVRFIAEMHHVQAVL